MGEQRETQGADKTQKETENKQEAHLKTPKLQSLKEVKRSLKSVLSCENGWQ